MENLKGACIIGQSGGPTAVINASAQGVIQTALASDQITRVLGAAHGIKGVLADQLYDMSQEDPAQLDLLQFTPWAPAAISWPTRTWTTPITSAS